MVVEYKVSHFSSRTRDGSGADVGSRGWMMGMRWVVEEEEDEEEEEGGGRCGREKDILPTLLLLVLRPLLGPKTWLKWTPSPLVLHEL